MKQSVLTFLLVTLSWSVVANGDINYAHKAIKKTLEKSCKLINAQFNEMAIPDDLSAGLQGKFFSVSSDNADSEITHMYVGRVNSCRAGGCSMPAAQAMGGDSEYFDYMVLYNNNREVILVKIFNYQATHGHEVTAKGWLKQFVGYGTESKDLEVGRNIDSISGATISVNGITQDISDKTKILNNLLSNS